MLPGLFGQLGLVHTPAKGLLAKLVDDTVFGVLGATHIRAAADRRQELCERLDLVLEGIAILRGTDEPIRNLFVVGAVVSKVEQEARTVSDKTIERCREPVEMKDDFVSTLE